MNKRRGGLSLLLQAGRFFFEKEESDDIPEEPQPRTKKNNRDPMIVFWESAKNQLDKIDEPYKDSFIEDVGLDSIPDTTEKAVVEHRYDFDSLSRVYLPEAVQNFEFTGGPDTTKTISTGISPGGRNAGVVAGIVVAVIIGIIIIVGLIVGILYRHYMHRNVTSMNFDNPVYRKTTHDHLVLEKNEYAPGSKLYPSTVGEEAQEPLNAPATNDFV